MLFFYSIVEIIFRKFCGLFSRMTKLAWKGKRWSDLHRYMMVQRPWSPGYLEAKECFLMGAIKNSSILKIFQDGKQLPLNYGQFFDERTIELPWFLAKLRKLSDGKMLNLLDAGSACNHIFYLPFLKNYSNLTIITFAPENVCENKCGISYTYGDIRDMPYRENLFDAVVSISTIEHIGMNNESFKKGTNENNINDLFVAIVEIHRVLKPGGMFFMSVPFGKYSNYGTFQQFDSELLDKCRNVFAPSEAEEYFYRYNPAGWQLVQEEDCANVNYTTAPVEGGAAAAGAVVCCSWRKANEFSSSL